MSLWIRTVIQDGGEVYIRSPPRGPDIIIGRERAEHTGVSSPSRWGWLPLPRSIFSARSEREAGKEVPYFRRKGGNAHSLFPLYNTLGKEEREGGGRIREGTRSRPSKADKVDTATHLAIVLPATASLALAPSSRRRGGRTDWQQKREVLCCLRSLLLSFL